MKKTTKEVRIYSGSIYGADILEVEFSEADEEKLKEVSQEILDSRWMVKVFDDDGSSKSYEYWSFLNYFIHVKGYYFMRD